MTTNDPTMASQSAETATESYGQAQVKLVPDEEALVRVENLKKHYYKTSGIINRTKIPIKAVDGVSFNVPKGQTFGLVGESGSGKSTVARCIVRIEQATSGSIEIKGQDVVAMSKKELKALARNVQIVYQNPGASLNPKKRIRQIIRKPLDIHDVGTETERRETVDELITTVGLPLEYKYKYPSELSGGEKQRVSIARALSVEPDLIVLDEPTSALDVSVQSNVLTLLDQLQRERNITYFFITHDLSLIRSFADWLGVMYLGKVAEMGTVDSVFTNPKHPYTRALISSIPTIYEEDEQYKPDKILLEGEIPDPSNVPSGCSFRTRCPKAFDECKRIDPGFYDIDDDHYARCLLYEDF